MQSLAKWTLVLFIFNWIFHVAPAGAVTWSLHRYAVSCPPPTYTDGRTSACRLTLLPAAPTTATWTTKALFTSLRLEPWLPHVHVFPPDVQTGNGVQDKGLVIESEVELYITLEQLDLWNDVPQLIDSTQILKLPDSNQILPLPEDNQQYQYTLVSTFGLSTCASSVHTTFFTLSSAYDGTAVSIYDNFGTLVNTEKLQKFETFTYVSGDDVGVPFNPIGYKITTNAPVSLISGSLCNFNGGVSAFFTAVQTTSHRQFVAPHIGNVKHTGYDLLVVNSEDANQVMVNGGELESIDSGEFIRKEYPGRNSTSVVECSKACTAYIVPTGSYTFDVGTGLSSIFPVEEMYSSVYFTTTEYDFPHYVSIVAEGAAPQLFLDGEPLNWVTWSLLSGFSSAWLAVDRGCHRLEAAAAGGRMAVYVFGHSGQFTAGFYGHAVWPAGIPLPPLTTTVPTATTTSTSDGGPDDSNTALYVIGALTSITTIICIVFLVILIVLFKRKVNKVGILIPDAI